MSGPGGLDCCTIGYCINQCDSRHVMTNPKTKTKKKNSLKHTLSKLQALCVLLRKEAFKGDLFWSLPARYIYSWTKVALYDSQLGATPLFIYTCQLPSSSLKPILFWLDSPHQHKIQTKQSHLLVKLKIIIKINAQALERFTKDHTIVHNKGICWGVVYGVDLHIFMVYWVFL